MGHSTRVVWSGLRPAGENIYLSALERVILERENAAEVAVIGGLDRNAALTEMPHVFNWRKAAPGNMESRNRPAQKSQERGHPRFTPRNRKGEIDRGQMNTSRDILRNTIFRSKISGLWGKVGVGFYIFSVVLALSFQGATAQEGWSILGFGSKGTLFYDPGRISDLGGGKKKVWIKFVYNAGGAASLKSRGERFAAAAYLTIPYEIDCLARKAACEEGIIYSQDDEPLGPFQCSGEETKGAIIFPESISEEALLEKVCP